MSRLRPGGPRASPRPSPGLAEPHAPAVGVTGVRVRLVLVPRLLAAADADRALRGRPHYARMMRAARALAADLAAAPVLIVCCLDHRQLGPIAGPDGTLLSPVAAYASIFPAVQNLLLAARALGLGTTLTTLHRNFEDDLKAILEVPAAVEVVAIVPLGHPADRFGPTRRKSVARGAFRDRWGKPFVADGGGGA